MSKVSIRTTDTDVVVLAVANFHKMGLLELWIEFGSGKGFQHIPAHKIADHLGQRKAMALPIFHAFTGCDTVSFFCGKGKSTSWNVWRIFPEVTDAFLSLAEGPSKFDESLLPLLERFVVLMYDKGSEILTVNQARLYLFSRCNRLLQNIPPTQAALRQHILRAAYQGGHIRGRCLVTNPPIPSPSLWGWTKSRTPTSLTLDGDQPKSWLPAWTTLPEASTSCQTLIRCGCKSAVCLRCKYAKAHLPCTALCKCGGDCSGTSQ